MSEQPYIYRYVDVEIAIATATEQERERIIKLLDEHTYYGQNDWLEFSDKVTTMADLEALIKGEQK